MAEGQDKGHSEGGSAPPSVAGRRTSNTKPGGASSETALLTLASAQAQYDDGGTVDSMDLSQAEDRKEEARSEGDVKEREISDQQGDESQHTDADTLESRLGGSDEEDFSRGEMDGARSVSFYQPEESHGGMMRPRDNQSFDTTFVLLEEGEEDFADEPSYIYIEETVMDDLGKEVKVKQKVPILRETHRFERVSLQDTDESGKPHHLFIETVTRVIKKSTVNAEGETEEYETELKEVIQHETRPTSAQEVYIKRLDEKGEEVEVLLTAEEADQQVVREKAPPPVRSEVKGRKELKKRYKEKEKPQERKKILKLVKQREVEPCSFGKVHEVIKPAIGELEEEESDFECYLSDEGLSEEDLIYIRDEMQRKREEKITKLKDNLRTVLVRLALAEKKRNLYMQLISISAEVKEDILNPPDPDKPTFKVPKKTRTEDKFRRMYADKLMEYRELRSVILVKLAVEKNRKEEVKKKYDVIAAEVAQLRKTLEDKLMAAIPKLLPKNDPVFKNQSPQAMVRRLMDLIGRLDNETKELMYKKKQMYLAKQQYDEVTENEQGLSYKFTLANQELQNIVGKNDRRNEKLEALKVTMQKESLAITHINQKCDAVLKTIDEKNSRLESLNQSLNRARQDRKDVQRARRKIDSELREERYMFRLKNHPSLIKEQQLIEELLRTKQLEFEHLRRECLTSLEKYKKMNNQQSRSQPFT